MTNPFTKIRSAITSSAIKRGGYQDFLRNHQMAVGELRRGDILLVKLYEDYQYWQDVDRLAPYAGMGKDGNSVLVAQAVFSHVKHGSATSEHVMLVADDGMEEVYESVCCGVIRSTRIYDRWHAVYRVVQNLQPLANEAARVAKQLGRQFDSTGKLMNVPPLPDEQTTASVGYRSKGGMAASAFRPRHAGRRCDTRLQRIYDIVYNNKQDLRNGLKMICSEFVATCYEVAAMRLNRPPLFNVDPRAMTAKALEAALYRSASYITQVGIYQGSEPIVRRCATCRGKVRCMYLIDENGGRLSTQVDGKTRYPYITICPNCHVCLGCKDVWAATFDPDPQKATEIIFFCPNCESFPRVGSTHRLKDDIESAQGGQIGHGGTRKKPKKSDDTYFVR
jgi:hypothetical protein